MWPLVVWRMHKVLTVAEFEAYLTELNKILARGERYAQLVVPSVADGRSALTVEMQKRQALWIKKNFLALQELCAAMGVVVTNMSPISHFTVSLLMSVIGRSPSPSKILTSEDDGIAWARAQLAKRPPGPSATPLQSSRARES